MERREFEKHYLEKKGKRLRTRHLNNKKEALFVNRLSFETSPYLLQHAHNPVNWWPWKQEAFEEAKKQNKPILLSIGYSTCHWCHVMEEESFEDLEIADFLNEHYIAIKVDREEHPEVDAIFMNAVQLITGRGGWPMTLWLTYERKPFFAGTYFPPRDGERGIARGFLGLIKELKRVYDQEREKVWTSSESLTQAIQDNLSPIEASDSSSGEKRRVERQSLKQKHRKENSLLIPPSSIERRFDFSSLMSQVLETCKECFDSHSGGLKGNLKFPNSFPLRFLFRCFDHSKDSSVFEMFDLTLKHMMWGGIHDQIGGGFHRYATDSFWRIPHFEKMLSDNASLVTLYLEAYQITQNPLFKETAEGILDYVSREMSFDNGGFYASSDADSLTSQGKKEEGHFFTWSYEEIKYLLEEKEFSLIERYYNLNKQGPHQGRNVLFISQSLENVSKNLNLNPLKALELLKSSQEKMYRFRLEKSPPFRDEKILLSWNASMISAYAFGFFVLRKKKYLDQAEKAARFVLSHLVQGGHLLRTFHPKLPSTRLIHACLEDYASFVSALLSLYEYTGNIEWLKEAKKWNEVLEQNFEDKERGGFFKTSLKHEDLPVREKSLIDGAEPSGNSIQAMNLLRFSVLSSGTSLQKSFLAKLEKMLETFHENFRTSPFSLSDMLLALDFYTHGGSEIFLVIPSHDPKEKENFLKELGSLFLPRRVFHFLSEEEALKRVQKGEKKWEGKKAVDGLLTAYVCENGKCFKPTKNPKDLL